MLDFHISKDKDTIRFNLKGKEILLTKDELTELTSKVLDFIKDNK